jgi:predicted ABC-type sugar transport system permease subunit
MRNKWAAISLIPILMMAVYLFAFCRGPKMTMADVIVMAIFAVIAVLCQARLAVEMEKL